MVWGKIITIHNYYSEQKNESSDEETGAIIRVIGVSPDPFTQTSKVFVKLFSGNVIYQMIIQSQMQARVHQLQLGTSELSSLQSRYLLLRYEP